MRSGTYLNEVRKQNVKEYSLFAFYVSIILLAIAVIIGWPLLVIFALNTLFPALAIPYTFWTWLAVVILNMTYLLTRNLKGN